MTTKADTTQTEITPLEDEEEFQRSNDKWDFEHLEVHEPARNPRSVYSVRFRLEDIRAIRAAAKAAGVTTSEFIRQAAIAAALDGGAAQLQMAIAELRDAVARTNSALDVIESAKTAAAAPHAD